MLTTLIKNTEEYYVVERISKIYPGLEDKMRKKFKILQNTGVILNKSFEDKQWKLTDENQTITWDFSGFPDCEDFIDMNPEELELACKIFFVLKLHAYTLTTLQRNLRVIHNFLKKLESNQDICYIVSSASSAEQNMFSEFLSVLNCQTEKMLQVKEVLQSSQYSAKQKFQRKLAPFVSYFRFSEIMCNFWEEASEDQKIEYFPLWLWWNLTTIIPIRPTEFSLLPRECLHYTDNIVKMDIRRTRQKKQDQPLTYHIAFDYEIERYQIPQELAVEIQRYLDATEKYPENPPNLLFRNPKGKKNRYDNLDASLKRFYRKVVAKQYKIVPSGKQPDQCEINLLTLGDTRHLAMISLILQGGNPEICKSLAGHEDIDISAHYYSNISELVESITYEMARKKRTGQLQSGLLRMNRTPLAADSVEISGGRCYSQKFVHENLVTDCIDSWKSDGMIGDCSQCRFFRPDQRPFLHVELKKSYADEVDHAYDFVVMAVKNMQRFKGSSNDADRAFMNLNHAVTSYQEILKEGYSNGT